MVDVGVVDAEMDGAVGGALSAHQRLIAHAGSPDGERMPDPADTSERVGFKFFSPDRLGCCSDDLVVLVACFEDGADGYELGGRGCGSHWGFLSLVLGC